MPRSEHRLAHQPAAKKDLRHLANQLIAWRKQTNTSQQELAERIGISYTGLRNLEECLNAPSFAVLMALRRETGLVLLPDQPEPFSPVHPCGPRPAAWNLKQA